MNALEALDDAASHVDAAINGLRKRVEFERNTAVRGRMLRALVGLTAAAKDLSFAWMDADGAVWKEVAG